MKIRIEIDTADLPSVGTPVDKDAGDGCPVATRDIDENLKNRKKAIDSYDYGPLDPNLDATGENTKFWQGIAGEFNTDVSSAMQSRCANCAAFNQTSQMLDCIAEGIGSEGVDDPYDTIEAGDLGYCQFLKFKCASQRVCTAWVSGGPITDDQMKTHGDMI